MVAGVSFVGVLSMRSIASLSAAALSLAHAALAQNQATGPIPIKTEPSLNTEAIAREFDKVWLPQAPQIAELRKAGASL